MGFHDQRNHTVNSTPRKPRLLTQDKKKQVEERRKQKKNEQQNPFLKKRLFLETVCVCVCESLSEK